MGVAVGWSGGSEIFSAIMRAAKKHMPDDEVRRQFYSEVYGAFCDADWDCENDCLGEDEAFAKAYMDKWG